MRSKVILLTLTLLLGSMIPVSAGASDTYTTIIITSDENVTANVSVNSINGSAVIYVDGVPLQTTISNIYHSIHNVNGRAISAYRLANNAWIISTNNSKNILLLKEDIGNNTIHLYLLRNELIIFENNYIQFKNRTEYDIGFLNSAVSNNSVKILKLNSMIEENNRQNLINTMLILIMFVVVWYAIIIILFTLHKIKKNEKQSYEIKKGGSS
ncbi:MAG: hypothetical protein GWP09_03095 [Nitrospiraceae bacterium]|nr:hypothetical protein [Nitrospiraceae bacterium]